MNVLLLRWDTKPDKRIRGTFPRHGPTRRTSFYAAIIGSPAGALRQWSSQNGAVPKAYCIHGLRREWCSLCSGSERVGQTGPDDTETRLRSNPTKQKNFDRLNSSGLLDDVVVANRVYLDAAVPDAESIEREYWALSCLPGSTRGRLSAISMRTMEVFVMHAKELRPLGGPISCFVIVSGDALATGYGSIKAFNRAFPFTTGLSLFVPGRAARPDAR